MSYLFQATRYSHLISVSTSADPASWHILAASQQLPARQDDFLADKILCPAFPPPQGVSASSRNARTSALPTAIELGLLQDLDGTTEYVLVVDTPCIEKVLQENVFLPPFPFRSSPKSFILCAVDTFFHHIAFHSHNRQPAVIIQYKPNYSYNTTGTAPADMTAIKRALPLLSLLQFAAAAPQAPPAAANPPSLPQPATGAGPFHFTSTYNLIATPDKVINANNTVQAGETGAIGYYNYGINAELDIICYVSHPFMPLIQPQLTPLPQNITLMGVTGPYDSPAVTATHIHEAAEGRAGPPRIAFPNPEPADSGPEVVKRSSGCITGPFTTGIKADSGADTGEGFKLSQIEANPEGFFTDSHTKVSVPGVVRAQMQANGAVGAGAPPALPPAGAAGGAQNASIPVHAQGPIKNAHGGTTTCAIQVVRVGPPVKVVCLD